MAKVAAKKPAGQKTKPKVTRIVLTEDNFNTICDAIAEGESLRAILKKRNMPSYSQFMAKLKDNPEWQEKYAGAREASADADADKVSFVSQQTLEGKIDPAAARVAIDGFKWSAGKRKPKVYGDRQTIDMNVNDTERTDEEIRAEAAKLAAKLGVPLGDLAEEK